MMYLKKFFLLIALFNVIFLLGIIFLFKSSLGLRTIFYCSHYFLPKFEVEELIGTLNNFQLKNFKYRSIDGVFIIKELHISFSINFFKKTYIDVNNITCKNIFFSLYSKNGLNKLNHNNLFMHFFKSCLMSIPITFKTIHLYNVSGNVYNFKIFLDNLVCKGFLKNKKLTLISSKINFLNINLYKFIKNQHVHDWYNIKSKSIFLKNKLSDLFNFLKMLHISVPISLTFKNATIKKVYFNNNKNFCFSNCCINLEILNNLINVNNSYFCYDKFKVNFFVSINFNDQYINLFLNSIKIGSHYKNENITVKIQGLYSTKFTIILHVNNVISAKINVNLDFLPLQSIYKLKLVLSDVSFYVNSKKILFIKKCYLKILKKSSKCFFDFYVLTNDKFISSIKLNFVGINVNEKLLIKSFNYNINNKCLYSYTCKYLNNFNTVKNLLLNEINLKKIQLDNSILLLKILKRITNSFCFIKQSFLVQKIIKTIVFRSSIYINSDLQCVVININMVLGLNIININGKLNKYLTYFDIFFKINNLNEFFSNCKGVIQGNVRYLISKRCYLVLSKLMGYNLDLCLFKCLNFKFLTNFSNNVKFNCLSLSMNTLTLLKNKINTFVLKIKNEKKGCFLEFKMIGIIYSYNLILNEFLRFDSYLYENIYNIFNDLKFFTDINVSKEIKFTMLNYCYCFFKNNYLFNKFWLKKLVYFPISKFITKKINFKYLFLKTCLDLFSVEGCLNNHSSFAIKFYLNSKLNHDFDVRFLVGIINGIPIDDKLLDYLKIKNCFKESVLLKIINSNACNFIVISHLKLIKYINNYKIFGVVKLYNEFLKHYQLFQKLYLKDIFIKVSRDKIKINCFVKFNYFFSANVNITYFFSYFVYNNIDSFYTVIFDIKVNKLILNNDFFRAIFQIKNWLYKIQTTQYDLIYKLIKIKIMPLHAKIFIDLGSKIYLKILGVKINLFYVFNALKCSLKDFL